MPQARLRQATGEVDERALPAVPLNSTRDQGHDRVRGHGPRRPIQV